MKYRFVGDRRPDADVDRHPVVIGLYLSEGRDQIQRKCWFITPKYPIGKMTQYITISRRRADLADAVAAMLSNQAMDEGPKVYFNEIEKRGLSR